ncbi:MAG: serine/threonine protein kinase [Polyangiaceae bacterium]|jgi:serine/threonine-protein kinase|nr:serine/threonine protein kinase [Polyangiaceae bacterium]
MTEPYVPASPYPEPGEIVGESWMVEKVLGEGGMGCVARAYHTVLHTPVALKFMNPQFMIFPGAVERFINEGKASGRIKSDHVVPVMDAKKLPNGAPYLVMECLEGLDLADLIKHEGQRGLPAERAVHFVVQILRGLQAAHAIGIIHRDMKPSNCFVVNKDGEDDFVKILDFGISKVAQEGVEAGLTRTNSTLGTPLYMSPEQAKNPRDVDARSDLYSVGAILYTLLAGQAPFFSPGVELLEILIKLVTLDPPDIEGLRPDLPPGLSAVVRRSLAREADDRYATALEMAEALAPFAGEHSAHVIERLRGFRAPARLSNPPPEVLLPSMVAFSQLERHQITGAHSLRPEAEARLNSPTAQTMELNDLELQDMPAGGAHLLSPAAHTPGLGARADRPALDPGVGMGAGGGRGIDVGRSPDYEGAAGVSLDPGQGFDVGGELPYEGRAGSSYEGHPSGAQRPTAPRRSPLVYALPVVVAFGVLGAVVGTMRRGGQAETETTTSPSAEPPSRTRLEAGGPSARRGAEAPPRGPEVLPVMSTGPAASAPPAANAASSTGVTGAAGATGAMGAAGASASAKAPPRGNARPPTSPPRDPGFDPGIKL